MNEMLPYLKTLKQRGFSIGYRELHSRFFRESPKKAIFRLSQICSDYTVPFTFFVVGSTVEANPHFMMQLVKDGHELASHGYDHVRFDLLTKTAILKNVKKSLEVFDKKLGVTVKGFRAPYLKSSDTLFAALGELGIPWSSSTFKKDTKKYDFAGVTELPVVVDDWEILIKRNLQSEDLLYNAMEESATTNAVLLLHPWRVGQKKYIGALQRFLQINKNRCVSMSELAQGKKGVALTGDIGELSFMDLLKRCIQL